MGVYINSYTLLYPLYELSGGDCKRRWWKCEMERAIYRERLYMQFTGSFKATLRVIFVPITSLCSQERHLPKYQSVIPRCSRHSPYPPFPSLSHLLFLLTPRRYPPSSPSLATSILILPQSGPLKPAIEVWGATDIDFGVFWERETHLTAIIVMCIPHQYTWGPRGPQVYILQDIFMIRSNFFGHILGIPRPFICHHSDQVLLTFT